MFLKIRIYPDPVLRKKSLKAGKIDSKTRELVENMLETMYASQGIGLSAPQVGVLKRISVVDIGDKEKRVFINPQIVKKKGRVMSCEGCLSIPGEYLEIKRSEKITVEALNENGEKFTIEADGLLARCIQHEIDHLDGILILDRISFWERIKRKLFTLFG